jgi:hypothetical protein
MPGVIAAEAAKSNTVTALALAHLPADFDISADPLGSVLTLIAARQAALEHAMDSTIKISTSEGVD